MMPDTPWCHHSAHKVHIDHSVFSDANSKNAQNQPEKSLSIQYVDRYDSHIHIYSCISHKRLASVLIANPACNKARCTNHHQAKAQIWSPFTNSACWPTATECHEPRSSTSQIYIRECAMIYLCVEQHWCTLGWKASGSAGPGVRCPPITDGHLLIISVRLHPTVGCTLFIVLNLSQCANHGSTGKAQISWILSWPS